jgi:hypothetical protein
LYWSQEQYIPIGYRRSEAKLVAHSGPSQARPSLAICCSTQLLSSTDPFRQASRDVHLRAHVPIPSRTYEAPGGSCRHHSTESAVNNVNNSHTTSTQGSCECGDVGWNAFGPSALSFVCHCSLCRAATSKQSLEAAAFNPDQVVWRNEEGMVRTTPIGSRNARLHCATCHTYVGEDATATLGVLAVPLASVAGGAPPTWHPTMHIFYGSRAADVAADDTLPKWETLPQGRLLQAGLAERRDVIGRDPLTGRVHKDLLATSPGRAPEPEVYTFTETDPGANHKTVVRIMNRANHRTVR